MWWGLSIPFSILLGLIVAVVLGVINGLLSITLKIHPMMITLATMTIFKGVTFLITKSQSIFNLPDSFKFIGQGSFIGIPVAFWITIVVFIFTSLLLHKTYFGRHVYAVGSNFQASHLAGINVGLVKVLAFAIGGFLIGIATVLMLARTGSANANMATGAEFNAITACVLGGISLKGGEGKPWGAVIGVLILGVLANGMQLVGFDLNAQYIAKGVLLIMAIGFDTYQRSRNAVKVKVKVVN
jgi:ribose/xylose/arabinose/galactoside ABC-type transport system permease subunit